MLTLTLSLLSALQAPVLPDWGTSFDHTTASTSYTVYPDYPAVMVEGDDESTFVIGQYAFNGFNAAGWFVDKVDRDGQPLWSRDAGFGFNREYLRPTDATSDGNGGVVLVGTRSFQSGNPNLLADDIFILHFDGVGNLVWETSIGDAEAEVASATGAVREQGSSIATDGAGGYWIGGLSVSTSSGYEGSLFRIDSNGVELARYDVLANSGMSGLAVLDLEPDGDGGIFAALPSDTPFSQSVARYDDDGLRIWRTYLDASVTSLLGFIGELALTGDRAVVAAGANSMPFASGPRRSDVSAFIKLDADTGAIRWSTEIAFDVRSGVTDIEPAGNGGLYVTGQRASDPSLVSIGEAYVARLDANGQLVWQFDLDPEDSGLTATSTTALRAWGSRVRVDRFGLVVTGMGGPLGLVGSNPQTILIRYVEPVGIPYCEPAAANSTGLSGRLLSEGSEVAAENKVILSASNLPPFATCLLVNSPTQAFIPGLAGGEGTLCLGGPYGRYIDLAQSANEVGRAEYALDLTVTPTPTGLVPVMTADTWNFQVWYRDANPTATSNLTNGISILFE